MIRIVDIPWFPKNCVLCADDLGTREDELCEGCRGDRIRANRNLRPPVQVAPIPATFTEGVKRETRSP